MASSCLIKEVPHLDAIQGNKPNDAARRVLSSVSPFSAAEAQLPGKAAEGASRERSPSSDYCTPPASPGNPERSKFTSQRAFAVERQPVYRHDIRDMEGQVQYSDYRQKRAAYERNLKDHQSTHQTHEAHKAFISMLLQEARRYQRGNAQRHFLRSSFDGYAVDPVVVLADIRAVEGEVYHKMNGFSHDGSPYPESLGLVASCRIWRRTK